MRISPTTGLWRAATAIWMVIILIASVLPSTAGAPGGTLWHLLGYAILGVLWGRWQVPWRVALLATGYGALIEGLQWVLPYRMAEVGDLLTNAAGVLIGLTINRLRIWTTPPR